MQLGSKRTREEIEHMHSHQYTKHTGLEVRYLHGTPGSHTSDSLLVGLPSDGIMENQDKIKRTFAGSSPVIKGV